MEGRNVLASAAGDGSTRLWTLEGHFIGQSLTVRYTVIIDLVFLAVGSFGQRLPWQLGISSTYQHPLAPEDIRLNIDLPEFENTQSLELALEHPIEIEGHVTSQEVGVVNQSSHVTDVEDDDQLLSSHISVGVPM